jgi:L-rhamnose-H+ transport protein
MASIIIFGTLWGIYFREWQGTTARARGLIALGILLLVASTIVIGIGTWLKSENSSADVGRRPDKVVRFSEQPALI